VAQEAKMLASYPIITRAFLEIAAALRGGFRCHHLE